MRKLLWFTIGFAGAVVLGSYWITPDLYFYISGGCALLLVVCLALMLRFPKTRLVVMVLFGSILGFLWQSAYDARYLSAARAYDDQTISATVTAMDASEATSYGCATQGRIVLDGKSYAVWIYHDGETVLSPGDTLTGTFLLRCTLPGGSSESDYNRSKGIFLTARAKDEVTAASPEKLPWYAYPATLRLRLTAMIDGLFAADSAGFAKALLLGDTDGIDYETDTDFKISGIRHVIAVSGLHVSILFSLVYFFTGRRKWLTAMVGIPVLIFFAAVAGFSPSITRACIMHGLTVLALLFEREYDPPTALAFAVLAMLTANPWTVTNVGFQLSVSCIAGIFLFAEPIKAWLLDKKRLGRWKGWRNKLANGFAVSISISLSASVITTPLCAYYFGMVSLVSVLTNLLTLWVISYIFYGIMLALVASLLLLPLGSLIAAIVSWGIRYVLWMAKIMADFPLAAVYTESIYIVFWLIFVYVLLGAFYLQKRKHPVLLGACAAFGLCVALLASWMEPLRDDMRMTVLDVGQGQCILLQSEGRNYLVDCGGDSDTEAANKAAALLLSQGIDRLDGLILTHYDADHAAGALYLLRRLDAEVLYLPTSADVEGNGQALQSYTGGTRILVQQDITITFGEAKITLIPSENAETDNESGLCVLFQRENCDILITGDRSAKGERELIEHMTLPALEVLIVGHHGSKYSTCRELLIKTSPEIAIISVGADNFYGHPTQEVLERLESFGCVIYRTDRHGTVIYRG